MNTFSDRFSHVSGSVEPYLLKDGSVIPFSGSHNTILLSSNKILAKIMSGDRLYVPSHIVFVVGTSALPAAGAGDTYSALIGSETSLYAASLFKPTVELGDSSSKITFSAHTGCGELIDNSGQKIEGSSLPSGGNNKVRRAILCSDIRSVASGPHVFVPFSVWDSSAGISVPSNAYFGVFWTITFGEQAQS